MFWIWIIVGFSVFSSVEAYAWAPATHLYFAKELLHFGNFLPAATRHLLEVYRADFFYGCLAADITLGKSLVEYLYNCHNFKVGWNLLKHAKTDAERAFVLGYNAHLAADTVSHNLFVPMENLKHLGPVQFRHAYWEVRLDQYFADRVWGGVEEVIRNERIRGHDRLLDLALKATLFSFKTNKVLFSSMLAIQRLKRWQHWVHRVNRLSSMQFDEKEIGEYNRLAVSAMLRLLSDEEGSCVFRVDPTGHATLKEAGALRKHLRSLKRRGQLTAAEHREQCRKFRSRVCETLFEEYPIKGKGFRPSLELFRTAS